MQERLLRLQDAIVIIERGLEMTIKTFVNKDGTVDGELAVSNLPDDWRTKRGLRFLVAALSNAFRSVKMFDARPSMGGAFWATFGVRFGPKTASEVAKLAKLYKRYRGAFQIGTYPTPAWGQGAVQVALAGDVTGLRSMMESLLDRRGLLPNTILIRFVYTPDGKRPGHYRGEK